ncbi:HAMP domain-containing histidine kinase [Actinomycetaceae bacterium WB03_NA08]|uniref:histidine kinase n=1 Tax=Scrofimicrobium canadense TaxID=2652290 RepID=A0A6N7W8W1_9ACTO|nr:HAMP domain-containing sensor histidine kinase [Scrofimicrobium canadense]MSS84588.1 HAMP domain-containing histidine kinase [Scrofimicrobium canadense]
MMKQWTFRRQLVTTIAVVFITGAAVLLAVQYFTVREIVSSEVSIGTGSLPVSICTSEDSDECIEGPQSGPLWGPDEAAPSQMPSVSADNNGGSVSVQMVNFFDEANAAIAQRLLLWSAVILVVFAIVAVAVANWLAGKVLRRVASISETAKSVTASDRSARLQLDGPNDEIKVLADTIDGMLERLDEALGRQERFVAAASHELRTPLATVRTSLEVPALQGRFPEDVSASVERALAANHKSLELLEALTFLSSVQLTNDRQYRGDFLSAVGRALEEVRLLAEEVGIVIHSAKFPAGDPTDPADRLVTVAIANLLRNAVIHNTVDGQVWVEADERTVRVLNTGGVLEASAVAEMSQPFNRGSETRLSGGGLGLGLTVVQAIAEHFDGTLNLEPRDGGGLEARLHLR